MNCYGCKWLDFDRTTKGKGYCAMVVRSKSQSNRCRLPNMDRCELYEAGDWKTRWETEMQKEKGLSSQPT